MRMGFIIILAAILIFCASNWFLLRRSGCCEFLDGQGRRYAVLSLLATLGIFLSWSVYPWIANFNLLLSPLASLAMFWMIAQALLLGLLLLLRPFFPGKKRGAPRGKNLISRRRFLQCAVGGAPLLACGVSGAGVYEAELMMEVKKLELEFSDLPPAFDGFTIAQLSDTHVGPYFSLRRLEEALALACEGKPDLLAITGDFVDDMALVEPSMAKVKAAAKKTTHGAFFCWGNHEYFRDLERVRAALRENEITLLDNSNCRIERQGQAIYLSGVDFPWVDATAVAVKRQQFFAWAMDGIPDDAFKVLLTHHPDFFTESFAAGVQLSLAGHTHGGQIKLFGKSLFRFGYRYLEGLYGFAESRGYVHTGTGQWLPFRLGVVPQVALITLRRKN